MHLCWHQQSCPIEIVRVSLRRSHSISLASSAASVGQPFCVRSATSEGRRPAAAWERTPLSVGSSRAHTSSTASSLFSRLPSRALVGPTRPVLLLRLASLVPSSCRDGEEVCSQQQ